MSRSRATLRQRRITRVSRVLAVVMTALPFLFVGGLAAYVLLLPEQIVGHPWAVALRLEPRPLSGVETAAVYGALLVASLPALWGAWKLRALFRGFATGAVFTHASADHLKGFALALMASSLSGPVGTVLLTGALSLSAPPGRRQLAVSIGSDDVGAALLGLVLLVIAWVMGEAVRVAEENAGFV